MINDIGIVDTKKIIAAINDAYSIDFSSLALTAFKRRVLKVMNDHNYSSIVDFIHRLENDAQLFGKYLSEGMIDTTEMFRDPSFWRDLRDVHLPNLFKTYGKINVHIPGVTSGDDVYSFVILLKESGFLNKTKIIVSSLSQLRLDAIKNGAIYDIRKMENSEANHKRFSGSFELSDYYSIESNKAIMNSELVENIEFKKYSYLQDSPLTGQHLILYRNKMIYCNATLQDKIGQKLFDSLLTGGILCVGSRENIETGPFARKLLTLNSVEKIYKKRTA
ncbi:MAG: hypothetical protein PHU27_07155 [Salinivirgaceae bacterium]|nr:hypothetical protein [Salinivirgaceae bacterium]MDD4747556.1 hypothetical protein [Salinivirgaceae bacterium]MDY0279450.1 CheR family methyltransferase [Salinivirgaceae bacterium]